MLRLQIHVCGTLCGLQAPSLKFASSLISTKWMFSLSSFSSSGDEREEGSHCIQWQPSIFIFYSGLTLGSQFHINAATLTITNTFMRSSQRLVRKRGQLLIIKRYLFWSCGKLNSLYIWPFFYISMPSGKHLKQREWKKNTQHLHFL